MNTAESEYVEDMDLVEKWLESIQECRNAIFIAKIDENSLKGD
jgi:hypothetical protein